LSESDVFWMYKQFKTGSLSELVQTNWEGYNKLFVKTGSNYRDIPETLGRFMFGYWLVRDGWQRKSDWIKRHALILIISLLCVSVPYFLLVLEWLDMPHSTAGLLYRSGIFCTTCLYGVLFLVLYKKFGALEAMGKMTLTLYLLVSAIMITLLYGIGLGLLGEIAITHLFFMACVSVMGFILCAPVWLRKFRFGPLEWLWKVGTYKRYFSFRNTH
jgi:uncharacterized protein